jgi:metallo-beta-lactamase class B
MKNTFMIATGVAVVMSVALYTHLSAEAQSAKVEAPKITGTAESHMAAAKASAGSEHAALYDRICSQVDDILKPPAPRGAREGGGAGRQAGPPPASVWHAQPMKVFDNLYFLGMTEYSAWAVTTSQGIILIDTIYDYSVEDEVVNGLKTLGLNPADIKYALVSHAHTDHIGGAKYLQDHFGTKVVMSTIDWDVAQKTIPARILPTRDIEAKDGDKLTLGDTTITMYVTPGHTPGTISTIFQVKDHGTPHTVATWGGTAFNFAPKPENFAPYIASAERFKEIVAKAKADVLLSNHTAYDNTNAKIAKLRTRAAKDPNPYVIGTASIERYLTTADECAKAGYLASGKVAAQSSR